jgi:hypothetical protein
VPELIDVPENGVLLGFGFGPDQHGNSVITTWLNADDDLAIEYALSIWIGADQRFRRGDLLRLIDQWLTGTDVSVRR